MVVAPTAQDDDGRDESPNQRMDRNWTELLQELRVTQLGVQILAFLLRLAFQVRSSSWTSFSAGSMSGLVILAAATIVAGPAVKPFPAAAPPVSSLPARQAVLGLVTTDERRSGNISWSALVTIG